MLIIVVKTNKNKKIKMSIKKLLIFSSLLLLPSLLLSSDKVGQSIRQDIFIHLQSVMASFNPALEELARIKNTQSHEAIQAYNSLLAPLYTIAVQKFVKIIKENRISVPNDQDDQIKKYINLYIIEHTIVETE